MNTKEENKKLLEMYAPLRVADVRDGMDWLGYHHYGTLDRDIRPLSVDTVFNQGGSGRKNAEWALSAEEMDGLMDAAMEKAAELTEAMRSGAIAAEPSADQDFSVCRYCEYLPVCHTKKKDERLLDRDITFRELARKTRCKNG